MGMRKEVLEMIKEDGAKIASRFLEDNYHSYIDCLSKSEIRKNIIKNLDSDEFEFEDLSESELNTCVEYVVKLILRDVIFQDGLAVSYVGE